MMRSSSPVVEYFLRSDGVCQVNRRHRHIPVAVERRQHEAERVSFDRIQILRDDLRRLERTVSSFYRLSRRIRHALFGLSLFFIMLSLAGPQFDFAGSFLGVRIALTVKQLSALLPLLLGYLIMYGTRVTIFRTRLKQRCWFIEADLRRLGFPTAYSIAHNYREWSRTERHTGEQNQTMLLVGIATNAYDVFLVLTILMAYAGSVIVAARVSIAEYGSHPVESILLMSLMAIGIILAIGSTAAFAWSRKCQDRIAHDYLLEQARRFSSTAHVSVMGPSQKQRDTQYGA